MSSERIPIKSDVLTHLRKDLHRYPEVSGNEEQTAERIVEFLRGTEPTRILENLGGHGIAAIFEYSDDAPTVLVRCELDALPIQEVNTMGHRSLIDGVSHKCGHDGHMAILAGLADVLHNNPLKKGNVILLFQPAEETGEGARAVLEDDRFSHIHPDHVIALHNIPGAPAHQIICREGYFSATVHSLIIKLHGKTAHSGEPDKGVNPAQSIAEILITLPSLEKKKDDKEFIQITPIHIDLGDKDSFGISAGYGELRLTARTWDGDIMQSLMKDMEGIVNRICKAHEVIPEMSWTQYFAANQNNKAMVELIKKSAKKEDLDYVERSTPFRWGEDFGLFTERYSGAMFGLGSGVSTPALHSEDYDFPDEIIPTGVRMFHNIIKELLHD